MCKLSTVLFATLLLGVTISPVHARSVYGDNYCTLLYGRVPTLHAGERLYPDVSSTSEPKGFLEPLSCDIYQCPFENGTSLGDINFRWECGSNTNEYRIQCNQQYTAEIYYQDSTSIYTSAKFSGGIGSLNIPVPRTFGTWPIHTSENYHIVVRKVSLEPDGPTYFTSHWFTIVCDASGYITSFDVRGSDPPVSNVVIIPPHRPATFDFFGVNIDTVPMRQGGDIVRLHRVDLGNTLPAMPCYAQAFLPPDINDAGSADLGPGDARGQAFATWTWNDPEDGDYAVCYNIFSPKFLSGPARSRENEELFTACRTSTSTLFTDLSYCDAPHNLRLYTTFFNTFINVTTAATDEFKKLYTLAWFKFGGGYSNNSNCPNQPRTTTRGTQCGMHLVPPANCISSSGNMGLPELDETVPFDYCRLGALFYPELGLTNQQIKTELYNGFLNAQFEASETGTDVPVYYQWVNDIIFNSRFPEFMCDEMFPVDLQAPEGETCQRPNTGVYVHLPNIVRVTTDTVNCSKVMYWGIETEMLYGKLTDIFNPTKADVSIHLPLASKEQNPRKAVRGCPGWVVFELVTPPKHHTGSGVGSLVPKQFTLNPDGTFIFLQEPSREKPVVWNGFDSFTYLAKCFVNDTGEPTVHSYCTNVVEIKITPCQVNPCPAWRFNQWTSAPVVGPTPVDTPGGWMLTAEGGDRVRLTCNENVNCSSSTLQIRHEYNRHGQLLRTWDVMTPNIRGDNIAPDHVDITWQANKFVLKSYGYIGNYVQRFGTFELFDWTPQRRLEDNVISTFVNPLTPSFLPSCFFPYQVQATTSDTLESLASMYITTPLQLRIMNPGATLPDGDGDAFSSNTNIWVQSWLGRFSGQYEHCTDLYKTSQCHDRPLLTPNYNSVWSLHVDGCNTIWNAEIEWSILHQMKTSDDLPIWSVSTSAGEISLSTVFFNSAIQPNDWNSDMRAVQRGWVEHNHKYTISIVLSETTEFQFEMGIDIFTVDLDQYRFTSSDNYLSFGYNMIIYPQIISNSTWQQNPDRRITKLYFYPKLLSCTADESSQGCAEWYEPTLPSKVSLSLGPSTSITECSNHNSEKVLGLIYTGVPGLSPANPVCTEAGCTCATNFQNVTFRGKSDVHPGEKNPFGFVGRIIVQFALENGEHPTLTIHPKLYMTSLCVKGAFAGKTATCRTSVNWPVHDINWYPVNWNLCEEPDARTFGPVDWAVIMFDIRDVHRSMVGVVSMSMTYTVGGTPTTVVLECNGACTTPKTDPVEPWIHYHALTTADLELIDAIPNAAHDMDWGFLFTPGAMNENAKFTISTRLQIKPSNRNRRFQSTASEPENEGTVNAEIRVDKRLTPEMRTGVISTATTLSGRSNSGNVPSNRDEQVTKTSSSVVVTLVVTALVCIVLIAVAAVVAVWYVRRTAATYIPKQGSARELQAGDDS